MSKEIIIHGRKVYPGVAEGEALVSKIPMMGWGNYNLPMGFTVERNHPLYEVPIKDKVLIYPYARGSGGFVMYGHSTEQGNGPKAMLFTIPYSVEINTALVLKRPSMTDFDQDPVELIDTGDYVVVNADEGYVKIIKKDA